jgi:hypothetical protein
MSSNWGPKLEKKLNALADSASKESIQTLANWIGFNRKHAAVIAQVLATALTTNGNVTRQLTYWQVIHELLLLQRTDSVKWERLLELRTLIGETTIVPAIEKNNNLPIIDKIEPLLKQWDDHNVFGGPTLVSQIRKLLVTAKTPATSTTTTTEESSTTTPKSPAAAASASKPAEPLEATTKEQAKETPEASDAKSKESTATSQDKPKSEVLLTPAQRRRSSLGSLVGEIDYDFEAKVRTNEKTGM